MITGQLAGVLRANRKNFNERFKTARRRFPNLAAEDFSAFLERLAAPLVTAVEQERDHLMTPVAFAVYDAGLVLTGRNLIGPNARQNAVEQGWRELLPTLVHLVAQAPVRIFSAVSNALYGLARTPGASPDLWIDDMKQMGPRCQEVDTLLAVGQVVAWRAGLAHFRVGALGVADGLPAPLALSAVGADPSAAWPRVRTRLRQNPWYDPRGGDAPRPWRIARMAGGFLGFGGCFARPPRVAADGAALYVESAGECWLLTADCFGHTFHRVPSEHFEAALGCGLVPLDIAIKDGAVKYRGRPIDLAGLGKVNTVAVTGHTLALTTRRSHRVALVALGPLEEDR